MAQDNNYLRAWKKDNAILVFEERQENR